MSQIEDVEIIRAATRSRAYRGPPWPSAVITTIIDNEVVTCGLKQKVVGQGHTFS